MHIREMSINHSRGAESIFSLYLSLDINPDYFRDIASEHIFYTPLTDGLSTVPQLRDINDRDEIKLYLDHYVSKNTFEISIPSLRDSNLSPENKTGMEVSILFNYDLAKQIC